MKNINGTSYSDKEELSILFVPLKVCCCKPTMAFTTAKMLSFEAPDFMLEKAFVFMIQSPFKSVQ